MDVMAYTNKKWFMQILKRYGLTLWDARDRFDAVIHLVTAAEGAEDFYVRNKVRGESPKRARLVDKKIFKAWHGHRAHFILDNSTNFKGKMERLEKAVYKILDPPSN